MIPSRSGNSTSKLSIIIMFWDKKNKWHLKPSPDISIFHPFIIFNKPRRRDAHSLLDDKLYASPIFLQVSDDQKMWFFLLRKNSPRWKLKPSKPAWNFIFMEIFLLPKVFHHLVLFWSNFYLHSDGDNLWRIGSDKKRNRCHCGIFLQFGQQTTSCPKNVRKASIFFRSQTIW